MNTNDFRVILRSVILFVYHLRFARARLAPPASKEQHQKASREAKKPSQSKPVTVSETASKKEHYTMTAYVKQITLARLMMDKSNQDSPALRFRLSVIEGFASDERESTVSEPVIIISCHLTKEKGVRQLIAPFKMSKHTSEFPDLQEVISQLQGMDYTLQDVHPAILANLPR